VLELLVADGWRYDDGRSGPPQGGRSVSEVYPYTTLVGAPELGYDVARPVYKRKPPGMSVTTFRPLRAATCDELIGRLAALAAGAPPLELGSHPTTAKLLSERSPLQDREYKHREDLIDALICAWTGLLWLARGTSRCQVLGDDDDGEPVATIIAPARAEQRP
jgi:predicted RNase H-like nuclease